MTTQLIIDTNGEHASPAPISMTMKAGTVLVRIPRPAPQTASGASINPPIVHPAPIDAGMTDEEEITWEDAEWQ